MGRAMQKMHLEYPLVEGLIGMQKDETKEVEMDFPKDFKIED